MSIKNYITKEVLVVVISGIKMMVDLHLRPTRLGIFFAGAAVQLIARKSKAVLPLGRPERQMNWISLSAHKSKA